MLSSIMASLINTTFHLVVFVLLSDNQSLRSAGDKDRRSKRFCSNAELCLSFT